MGARPWPLLDLGDPVKAGISSATDPRTTSSSVSARTSAPRRFPSSATNAACAAMSLCAAMAWSDGCGWTRFRWRPPFQPPGRARRADTAVSREIAVRAHGAELTATSAICRRGRQRTSNGSLR